MSAPLDGSGAGPQSAPLVDESGVGDNDSALGDSVAGSFVTASLASSVLKYTYENGRRYHAYHAGNYLLPNDEEEQERLDYLHHLFRLLTGGPCFRAPLGENRVPQRVLDMGCGTGIWCIQVSDDWPEATVIGVDLSPIQPSWVPPNCRFYVDDIETEWTYSPAEHFDYIHGRCLLGSISDWKVLLSRALNNLKPGGYLELQDCPHLDSVDGGMGLVPNLTDWAIKLCDGMATIGKPLKITRHLKSYMEEMGFVDVREEIHKVPIGPWARGIKNKELGLILQTHITDTIEPFSLAIFTRVLGYTSEQTHAMIERVKNDLAKTEAHLFMDVYFIWGRKPE